MTQKDLLEAVAARYAVSITETMAGLIDPLDPADPIAAQFLPHEAELDRKPHEVADPLQDAAHAPAPGVVRRYRDRALIKLTTLCPVYCRFCFRREDIGPGPNAMLAGEDLEAAFDYVAREPDLWEVILTGGDPLTLSDRRIAEVSRRLAAIDHVKVVRWHTRAPVVQPERVGPGLIAALAAPGKAVWVAVHANHARELTPEARAALAMLAAAGYPLISQTVLLKGVNDDPAVLEELMRALVESRVKPYYLHQLDPAPGTDRFCVPVDRGRAIAAELRARASGLAQPLYVVDRPDAPAKTPL